MKYLLSCILICLVMLSCKSGSNGVSDSDSTKKTEVAIGYSGPLNLAKLTLKENVPALMAAQKIKLELITDTDKTLFGLDRMKSNDAKAMQFDSINLAGISGKNKNYVLLHYDENTKKLFFYEVTLYNRAQATVLHTKLKKMGKPSFERKWPDGSWLAINEKGEAVPPNPDEKQIFQIWDDKRTGISYFYTDRENSHSFVAVLTVLRKTDKVSKDWMSVSGLDWYPKP